MASFELGLLRKLRGYRVKPVETYEEIHEMFFGKEETEEEIEEQIKHEILSYFSHHLKADEKLSQDEKIAEFRKNFLTTLFGGCAQAPEGGRKEESRREEEKSEAGSCSSQESENQIKEVTTDEEEEGCTENGQ